LNNRERESFIKSFIIFYLVTQVLVLIIAFLYYSNEVRNKKESLFLQMQNYSLTLDGNQFTVDIATKSTQYRTYTLYEEKNLFALFPISGIDDTVLKVILSKEKYDELLSLMTASIIIYLFFAIPILVIASLLFSFYTLRPLRESISFLEEFLKDMIHDLNTPVSAILLNTRLLKKAYKPERVERIEISAKTIGSLHSNLETLIRDTPLVYSNISIKALIEERITYFESIYSDLTFSMNIKDITINTNEDALRRIIDNILSNACKYNKPKGSIDVTVNETEIIIKDSGIGIKDSKKIFNRFYKEGERGLGIGLHIVKKLCDSLGMIVIVDSSEDGSTFRLLFKTNT
jgi:two-component system, OmpR family, sensor kinase